MGLPPILHAIRPVFLDTYKFFWTYSFVILSVYYLCVAMCTQYKYLLRSEEGARASGPGVMPNVNVET